MRCLRSARSRSIIAGKPSMPSTRPASAASCCWTSSSSLLMVPGSLSAGGDTALRSRAAACGGNAVGRFTQAQGERPIGEGSRDVTTARGPGKASRELAAQPLSRIARDPAAFEVFYREHVTLVTRFVARRVADPHAVADLTAEVFLAVIASAHAYRPSKGAPVA